MSKFDLKFTCKVNTNVHMDEVSYKLNLSLYFLEGRSLANGKRCTTSPQNYISGSDSMSCFYDKDL